MRDYLNYVGVAAIGLAAMAVSHYWPDQQVTAAAMSGIAVGWLGKHLAS